MPPSRLCATLASSRFRCLAVLAVAVSANAQTYTCGKNLTDRATDTKAGFDLTPAPQIRNTTCTGPFFFSAPLPEGNYTVTVVRSPATTVKAEGRRLMLPAAPGTGMRKNTFTVNIRTPKIPTGGEVKLKPRELGSLRWDGKLTLEFSGDHAMVKSIHVAPSKHHTVTVFLAGDSTVVDQDKEPWAAWGQMLPAFFNSSVSIANHAESGETIRSSTTEKRFDKIFSQIRPNDFLFMQFAHNDQKPGPGNVPIQTYTDLMRRYIRIAREKGAIPVLVTSMNRRTFDEAGHIRDTLSPYPETVRRIAVEDHVALIDLNSMSKTLYEAIGEPHSREMFVYAAANTYPGQAEPLHDDTHFNSFGAYELARCVVLGIQQQIPALARYLREPDLRFDPEHPDAPDAVKIPATPFADSDKPYER